MQFLPKFLSLALFAGTAVSAPPPVDLRRTCTRCHSLDVVKAQRLSREEWEDELRKMASMGAKIPNRTALLNYLAKTYGVGAIGSGKKPVK